MNQTVASSRLIGQMQKANPYRREMTVPQRGNEITKVTGATSQ
jgi:hypothetical protein